MKIRRYSRWGIAKIHEAVMYKKPHPYEAIYINAEWLRRFGFELWTDDPHDWYLRLPNENVLLISDKGRCAVLIQDYDTKHDSVQASSYLLLYAHQLQNLYFTFVEEELILKPKE